MEQDTLKKAVRERYGAIAENRSAGCCGGSASSVSFGGSQSLGYEQVSLDELPDGADLGLGCGNPTALASIKEGEVVLDLGSGAGIDCFLAAKQVGPSGRVIGVDMTAQMLEKARTNAEKGGYQNVSYQNVEFRLGEAEHLPVADSSIDLIISNCVINLAPDKTAVFRDSFRVLKPGGRLAVSDIVTQGHFSPEERTDMISWTGCIAGADDISDYVAAIRSAGFSEISVRDKAAPDVELANSLSLGDGVRVFSARVTAVKPNDE